MHDYRSAKDKADEWNLSLRHVQYLCRSGRIEGAIKRAEVWFIPADAASPAKKTKQGGEKFRFVGTKKNIFFSAIELFVAKGFDFVSMRDIADKVGIRQSTIYIHFGSKQEILDIIYDFYCHYYLENRPSLDEMEVMLKTESLSGIIKAIGYDFKEEYIQVMSDITKILFQRIGLDSRARMIAKTLMTDEGIDYVETVFNLGIESGRFAPFDTRAMAILINSVRIFTLYQWIIDPSPGGMAKLREDEQTLYRYASTFVKDTASE